MNHNFEANKAKAAKIMFYLIKVVRTTKEAKDTSADKTDLPWQTVVVGYLRTAQHG